MSLNSTWSILESLLKEDEAFWREMIKPLLREDNLVVLIGKASKSKLSELLQAEGKFIADRKSKLGQNGLAEKAKLLKAAKAAHDANQIPDALLKKIPVPSVDSIILPNVKTLRSLHLHPEAATTNKENNEANITKYINVLESPYALQISHYESHFVQLEVYAHTGGLELELKHLLGIYLEQIFHTDVQRGDKVVTSQAVEMEMSRETQNHKAEMTFPDFGIISIKVGVEKDKFLQGLQYLKEGLTQQIVNHDRLLYAVVSQLQNLDIFMNLASVQISSFLTSMLYEEESYQGGITFVAKKKLLVALEKDLKENGGKDTMAKFKRITEYLKNPDRLIFHIGGDITAIGEMLKKKERKDLEQVRRSHCDVVVVVLDLLYCGVSMRLMAICLVSLHLLVDWTI